MYVSVKLQISCSSVEACLVFYILVLNHFDSVRDIELRLEVGQSYSIDCVPPPSVPKANMFWILRGPVGAFKAINTSLISVNEKVSLHVFIIVLYFNYSSNNEQLLTKYLMQH